MSRLRARDPRGFTILELMVAMAVVLIILPTLAMTVASTVRQTLWVDDALDRNNDAQRIGAAWTADVQSVDVDGVNQQSCNGGTGSAGGTALVSFRWQSGSRVATWVTTGSGNRVSLWRRTCTDGTFDREQRLARSLGDVGSQASEVVHGASEVPPGSPSPFCPGSGGAGRTCTIRISGSWTYSLTVARRVLATAAVPTTTTTTTTTAPTTTTTTTQPPTLIPGCDGDYILPNLLCNPSFERFNPQAAHNNANWWPCREYPIWGVDNQTRCGTDGAPPSPASWVQEGGRAAWINTDALWIEMYQGCQRFSGNVCTRRLQLRRAGSYRLSIWLEGGQPAGCNAKVHFGLRYPGQSFNPGDGLGAIVKAALNPGAGIHWIPVSQLSPTQHRYFSVPVPPQPGPGELYDAEVFIRLEDGCGTAPGTGTYIRMDSASLIPL